MKKIISILLGLTLAFTARAHSAKVAKFQIVQKDHFTEIYAEFPWTLRNAILDFKPALNENNDPVLWEKTLKDYFSHNLYLWNSEGEQLDLLIVTALENDGHDHAIKYLITLEGGKLKKIKNTIMFNVSDKHENNHIYSGERLHIFKTTPNKPEYSFELLKRRNKKWLWVFFLIAITITSFVFMRMRHKIYRKQKENDDLNSI